MTKFSTILAIETSCDETAAAVIKTTASKHIPRLETLSSVVKSQIPLHAGMGGVVPEVAARAHIKNILPVVKKALQEAGVQLADINFLAVTQGPGLAPSLIVGVEFAKALSLGSKIPLIAVNHMAGHLYSALPHMQQTGQKTKNIFPHIALIVSGGHTMLVHMKNIRQYTVLGQTVDDAAGEAFDKVAKLLRLPYPGGPEVSKLAELANAAVEFPRPMLHAKNYNFSFSGLKTAVLYHVQNQKNNSASPQYKANVCAGFQNAAVDVLVTKTMRAVLQYRAKSASVSGGVAANKLLRETLSAQCAAAGIPLFVPGRGLATDNAEMIAIAAAVQLSQKPFTPAVPARLQAHPSLAL